ncbi:MAG TPA: type IV pilus secretin PilQ, partial [Polyangia bacterium]
RRRLAETARSLAEREAAVARATRELERREAAASAAGRELDALTKQTHANRQDLARARNVEAERLNQTVARRAEEETRLAAAAAARQREEVRRAKAEAERARVESERQGLASEVERLRAEVAQARKATVSAERKSKAAPTPVAPPPPPMVVKATVPAPAAPAASAPAEAAPGPRSVTLRPPSRVENIDFIDEPTRCSIIIDLDEPSAFAVERLGGRRVSLRLYKTLLPEVLERSLDATEFLGPIRIISSYRDPSLRFAVRIDVDMAEDVPNDVRSETIIADFDNVASGVRLRWNFRKTVAQKIEFRRRPLAIPAFEGTISMPRKIAGFSSEGWLAPMVVAQALAQAPMGTGMVQRPNNGKKRFTGRRIDLDFKGADIHNILRLLADVGGVNIVTSDDVKGEVTIKMRDVPWDQALDVVLRQKQLGQVREGNLVRVAPLQVLEKELEQEIARQKQITEVLPTETRLIGVSYAEAKQLTDRVKDLLSPRGKISVDERTNTLIVSDVGRNLALVEELVRNLDTQTSQVVIEARIVEARSTFVRQIGVQWGGTGFADSAHGNPTGLVFPNSIGIGGGATDGKTPVDGLTGAGAANPNFAVNLPAAVGTGSGGAIGLTMGSVAGAFNLNLRLSAMESTGQVRILSSPRISTLDNTEASIEQGVSIPISVVSAQGVQTVFVDAKLNLTVKPHVTNEGTVMMEIKVQRNEPDFVNTGARGDPTILKKEANTKMLVRDGDTAVIGGIYQRNSGLSYAKVPFLADLPVLGYLFRARRENDDRTEFLVFITPRIANRARSLGQ